MSSLHETITSILTAITKTNISLSDLKTDATEIEAKYDPAKLARTRFNDWRNRHEGHIFKEQQYDKQQGKCANTSCKLYGQVLPIEYFEIDHKLPLKTYSHLALSKKNLQLLCTPCNKKKSYNV
jgi:5-methylcytosine-specific restriction endonuclease McrA